MYSQIQTRADPHAPGNGHQHPNSSRQPKGRLQTPLTIDTQAWLVDVLPRLPDHPARRIDDLLP
ncbi:transposase domain-containing protein [Methylobacterium thuringiense]|uniref:transposase domain-containing protein n=1 Tax=Methylobacterium thuringiense TaxID=1003091 RepID=UPI003570E7B1